MTDQRVAIAGAGFAGLTLAALLAQRGWSVRLFERGSELREWGAGVYLRGNSLEVLDSLGIGAQVKAAGATLVGQVINISGQPVVRRDISHIRKLCVLRPALHRLLVERCEELGVEIVTGSPAVGADPRGKLLLADGTEVSADLVVGADGVNSVVRDSLGLGRTNRLLFDGATRVLIERGDDLPYSIENWSGRLRLGGSPCAPDRSYIFMITPSSDQRAKAVPIDAEYWIRAFPHLEDLVRRLEDPIAITHHPHPFVRCTSWVKGRAAIIGDSANAQPPNLGQGAGMAISNAHALALALEANGDVPAVLQEWDRTRRPLSEAVQRWSRTYGWLAGGRVPRAVGVRAQGLLWGLRTFPRVRRRWDYLASGGTEHDKTAVDSLLAA